MEMLIKFTVNLEQDDLEEYEETGSTDHIDWSYYMDESSDRELISMDICQEDCMENKTYYIYSLEGSLNDDLFLTREEAIEDAVKYQVTDGDTIETWELVNPQWYIVKLQAEEMEHPDTDIFQENIMANGTYAVYLVNGTLYEKMFRTRKHALKHALKHSTKTGDIVEVCNVSNDGMFFDREHITL